MYAHGVCVLQIIKTPNIARVILLALSLGGAQRQRQSPEAGDQTARLGWAVRVPPLLEGPPMRCAGRRWIWPSARQPKSLGGTGSQQPASGTFAPNIPNGPSSTDEIIPMAQTPVRSFGSEQEYQPRSAARKGQRPTDVRGNAPPTPAPHPTRCFERKPPFPFNRTRTWKGSLSSPHRVRTLAELSPGRNTAPQRSQPPPITSSAGERHRLRRRGRYRRSP